LVLPLTSGEYGYKGVWGVVAPLIAGILANVAVFAYEYHYKEFPALTADGETRPATQPEDPKDENNKDKTAEQPPEDEKKGKTDLKRGEGLQKKGGEGGERA
jgi:hypothetical protein